MDELEKQTDELDMIIRHLKKLLGYLEYNFDYIDGIKLMINEAEKDFNRLNKEYQKKLDYANQTTVEEDRFEHYFDMGFHPERYE